MADNTLQTANDNISTDDLGSVKVQRVKVQVGADGEATDVHATNPLPTSSAALALRMDEATATTTYVGEASPATLTSAALWRIKRISTTSGVVITWADGNNNFDNVWDNRASLSYS